MKNIRFTLTILGRTTAPGYEPPFGDAGWEALQKALKVRHRLTHPKTLDDLAVSDAELDDARRALRWFRSALASFAKCAADNYLARFNSIIEGATEKTADVQAATD